MQYRREYTCIYRPGLGRDEQRVRAAYVLYPSLRAGSTHRNREESPRESEVHTKSSSSSLESARETSPIYAGWSLLGARERERDLRVENDTVWF